MGSLFLQRLLPGKRVKILSVDGGGIRGYLGALILEEIERRREQLGRRRHLSQCFDLFAGTSTGSLITLGLTTPEFDPPSFGDSGRRSSDQDSGDHLSAVPPAPVNILTLKAKQSTAFTRKSSGGTQDDPGDIPGKSTGLSSGLTRGLSEAGSGGKGGKPKYGATDIARMYRERGLEIFPRHIFNQLKTVRHAFVEKYDAGSFDRVLLENFGDLTLKDLLSTVLITSYDTLEGKPLIMKNLSREDNFLVREAARGSSAAPTYFRPVEVRGLETGKLHCLVDGGVFANNPAMCAYVEARRLFPLARHMVILSLGSGRIHSSYSLKRMKSWGYVEWVMPSNGVPLISMMSSGQNRCVDYQLDHFPGVTYIRLNPSLEGCNDEMDDAGEKNMECLKKAAERCILENDELISWVAKIL